MVKASMDCLLEVYDAFESQGIPYLLVGGWVPGLLFPEGGHVGSIDADFLLKMASEENISKKIRPLLEKRGFVPNPDPAKWFSFQKAYSGPDGMVTIDVDLLTESYGGTSTKHRSNKVEGVKALKITGGDYAFSFEPLFVGLPDQKGKIKVVNYIPFIIMKSLAMDDSKRNKPKDAYDIYFVLSKAPNYDSLCLEFSALVAKAEKQGKTDSLVQRCSVILEKWFPSPAGRGPNAIIGFEHPNSSEEEERIRQSAYQFVHNFIKR